MIDLIWHIGNRTKKYKVDIIDNGKKIKSVSFGDRRYQQYEDRTPLKAYSYLNHFDKDRRELYRKRAEGILDKAGNATYLIKYSPNWFSYYYLW